MVQERGPLFVEAGTEVYEGMVIGASMKETMVVNPVREKKAHEHACSKCRPHCAGDASN